MLSSVSSHFFAYPNYDVHVVRLFFYLSFSFFFVLAEPNINKYTQIIFLKNIIKKNSKKKKPEEKKKKLKKKLKDKKKLFN